MLGFSPPTRAQLVGTAVVVCLTALLPWVPVDRAFLLERSAHPAIKEAAAALEEEGERGPFSVLVHGEPASQPIRNLVTAAGLAVESDAPALNIQIERARSGGRAEVSLQLPPGQAPVASSAIRTSAPLIVWTSLLPPLVAIALALLSRRLLLSLGLAIGVGSVLHFGPLAAAPSGVSNYFWATVALDPFKLWIIAFTVALIGMMAVCTRAGGTHGVVDLISRRVRGPRSAQTATGVMGCLIFFDDYANSVVVGATMRPLTDRLRVSREKLAYLVDATAAPIAGLAIVSTWIGYEIGLLETVSRDMGLASSGFEMFLSALPYRFYCVFALVLVFVVAISGRDFGPMRAAELRARKSGKLSRDGATPLVSEGFTSVEPKPGIPRRWYNVAIPIAVVLFGAVVGLVHDGGGFERLAGNPLALFNLGFWRDTLGASDNNVRVLGVVAILGSLVAFGLALGQRLLGVKEAVGVYWIGVKSMWIAVVTLVLAWALAAVATDLGTAPYLVALLKDVLPPALVPVTIFLAAASVAFATGTSWGTMSILIPTAVPLAYGLGGMPLAVIAMGAVLDGAIFGDHCSPISDTTLLSSLASSCDHLDHVKTQLPYALLGTSVAVGLGYLPATLGAPLWACYPGGMVALIAMMFLVGRRTDAGAVAAGGASGAAAPAPPEESVGSAGRVGTGR